ncbi:MAG: ATP-dependent zinc protease [Spongiibacteraceae bacterium]|nr:ATP-dependent zinc protease [Spongiibacteraceae bacterium]
MRYCAVALAALLLSPSGWAEQAPQERPVYGWVEKIKIMPLGAIVAAKLDSGALTSSMHATDIEYFERDGEEWVRFRIEVEDKQSKEPVSEVFERQLVRDQTVRGAGGSDERPVVMLEICAGNEVYREQFALRDREQMNYPALLGRRTIQHLGLLDVTATFLVEPACESDARAPARRPRQGDIGNA